MSRTYTLTAGGVLTKARTLLNDSTPDPRATDTELLGTLTDALNAMVGVFPGLFSVTVPYSCVTGYLQEIILDRAVMFLNVVGVPEGNEPALTQFSPGWMNGTEGAIREFMRVSGDPLRFMTDPPSPTAQALSVRVVQAPEPITATETTLPIPEVYEPALVDYVVGRAEMKDDEHANSGRASQLMELFVASVKALALG